MTTGRTSEPRYDVDADMKRAIEAMRESVRDIQSKDYGGALVHAELACLLIRIAAAKERK